MNEMVPVESAPALALLPMRSENADATGYVCTRPEEGLSQLEILISLGCKPHHRVLEIGCGALVAGFPIIQYLKTGHYSGVDPNSWLIESTLKIPEVAAVVAAKRPKFYARSDFRARPGAKFDFIISHSILSHASDAQLTEFFAAASEQLSEDGVLVSSIRLAEGNEFGSPGSSRHGAYFTEWQYPGVSWFRQKDVLERARREGLSASVKPHLTRMIMRGNPKAIHDWVLVRRACVTLVTGFFRLSDRTVDEDEQFRKFDLLAMCGLPIVLFLDEQLMDRAPKQSNVQVIPTKLGDLWPFQLDLEGRCELPKNRTPNKDTIGFLLLQNSKIEMLAAASSKHDLLKAIGVRSTHFAWIDFGVMKISSDPVGFCDKLVRLVPPGSCVLAPGCWSKEKSDKSNPQSVNWRFCGGFLLVDRDSIPGLVAAHRAAFRSRSDLTWEVNVWADMERAGQKFDWYQADHDDSLVAWASPEISLAPLDGVREAKICLVMIVKNEGAIIERCLRTALPFIDSWCITDTGSTDSTPELIERFFFSRNVPGTLNRSAFQNFAQARNESLRAANEMGGWDYALLVDADMAVRGTINKRALRAPAYKVFQHDGVRSWSNTRLVRREAYAAYYGVTHEYLSVEGVEDLSGFDIDDIGDGGSKSDKGSRDIRLLTEGLAAEPNNERYMFYLAQTYRETDRPHRAITWYKKRIESGGWDEEIWASYYGLALSYKELGDEANFVKSCFDAYNYRPSRGESLKTLAQYYREKSNNETALIIADALSKIKYPGDYLFVDRTVYDSGAAQELAIAGYYAKSPARRKEAYEACMDLTLHENHAIREEARTNATFYAKSAREMFGAETRQIEWKPSNGWAPMNPSVCTGEDGERLVLVRTVNYTIADGNYPTIDGSGIIRTRNYVVEMNPDWRPTKSTLIEDAPDLYVERSKFPVEGYEDCRLWRNGSAYFVSTTVRDLKDNHDGRCEMAIASLDEQWRVEDLHAIRDYEYNKTQKNWMPVSGRPGAFLYLCDPTIVIEVSNTGHTTELTRNYPDKCLKDFRGGSQLIPFDGGWLCITHEVAWRPERVYLHRFVRLDAEFNILVISDPFYFEKVGIEFCAGIALDGNRIVASFGVNDAAAYLCFFDTDNVGLELKIT